MAVIVTSAAQTGMVIAIATSSAVARNTAFIVRNNRANRFPSSKARAYTAHRAAKRSDWLSDGGALCDTLHRATAKNSDRNATHDVDPPGYARSLPAP